MTPDYERAAIAAYEILIKHNISTAPVDPLLANLGTYWEGYEE